MPDPRPAWTARYSDTTWKWEQGKGDVACVDHHVMLEHSSGKAWRLTAEQADALRDQLSTATLTCKEAQDDSD